MQSKQLEIQNFSDQTWDKLEIAEKPEWLTVDYQKIPPPQSDSAMKQRWLADVHVETKGLSPGEHRGEIVFKFGEKETKSLPVVLQITSAVSAIPAQFFFGNIAKNETATKNIKIVFSPDSVPKEKNEVHFEHDFGENLLLNWISVEGETWELQASLTWNDEKIPDDSIVTMTFSNPTLPKIQLPVYVMFNTEAEP
jgi:hypothetical protein